MKTIETINREIKSIEDYISKNLEKISDKKIVREKNKIEFYNHIKRCLESQPTEEYIKSERERLANLIKTKESKFEYWKSNLAPKNVDPKKFKSMFNKEVGLTLFKKQLKTIEFILEAA